MRVLTSGVTTDVSASLAATPQVSRPCYLTGACRDSLERTLGAPQVVLVHNRRGVAVGKPVFSAQPAHSVVETKKSRPSLESPEPFPEVPSGRQWNSGDQVAMGLLRMVQAHSRLRRSGISSSYERASRSSEKQPDLHDRVFTDGSDTPASRASSEQSITHGACRRAQPRRSRMIAMPCPPPTHMVSSPIVVSVVCRPLSRVVMIRAPVMPNGCPSAIAPPCTLSLS